MTRSCHTSSSCRAHALLKVRDDSDDEGGDDDGDDDDDEFITGPEPV